LSYRKGASLEYKVKAELEKQGFFVIRSAGSHGLADLVAIKREPTNLPFPRYWTRVYFVQVSYRPKPLSEIKKLIELSINYGGEPMIVFTIEKDGRRRRVTLKGSEVLSYVEKKGLLVTI